IHEQPAVIGDTLRSFADDVYFHQVVERDANGKITRYRDLDVALASRPSPLATPEWRIHFHIPLHAPTTKLFATTANHLLGVLDVLAREPRLCSHLEMETYTWEVMPSELKKRDVVDQLVGEYEWTLAQLAARGLA
ncbi:MAG: hypothetical protein HY300_12250, partial [Verrucomicrobia bacterium]|nr:hypothetical protein [Verrucomicrobiota bacterium]